MLFAPDVRFGLESLSTIGTNNKKNTPACCDAATADRVRWSLPADSWLAYSYFLVDFAISSVHLLYIICTSSVLLYRDDIFKIYGK